MKDTGGVVLANGLISSGQSGEDVIRRAMVEADVVDCMISMQGEDTLLCESGGPEPSLPARALGLSFPRCATEAEEGAQSSG